MCMNELNVIISVEPIEGLLDSLSKGRGIPMA